MSGFSNPIIGGGGALVYPAIMSPDFDQASLTGWAIKKDGSAFFYNVTVSGEYVGNNFIINKDGAFYYTGTPAANNLAISNIPGNTGVIDPFGNHALPGVTQYFQAAPSLYYAVQNTGLSTNLYSTTSMTIGWTGIEQPISFQPGSPTSTTVLGGQVLATAGTAAAPSLITTDTPHVVAGYQNNWSGAQNLTYTLNTDDTVTITGRLLNSTAGGGIAGASFINNPAVPSEYMPSHDQPVYSYAHASATPFSATVGGYCLMRASGFLEFFGSFTTADTLEINGTYPLSF